MIAQMGHWDTHMMKNHNSVRRVSQSKCPTISKNTWDSSYAALRARANSAVHVGLEWDSWDSVGQMS